MYNEVTREAGESFDAEGAKMAKKALNSIHFVEPAPNCENFQTFCVSLRKAKLQHTFPKKNIDGAESCIKFAVPKKHS